MEGQDEWGGALAVEPGEGWATTMDAIDHEPTATVDRPAPRDAVGPAELRWHRSYERAGIERFVAEVEAERARLRAELDAARAATAAAAARSVAGQAAAQASLGALVIETQRELEAMERAHQETIDGIRSAAAAEATRVLEAAHAEAAAVRSAAAAISQIVEGSPGLEEVESHPSPVPDEAIHDEAQAAHVDVGCRPVGPPRRRGAVAAPAPEPGARRGRRGGTRAPPGGPGGHRHALPPAQVPAHPGASRTRRARPG
jgi:hypothetical protein